MRYEFLYNTKLIYIFPGLIFIFVSTAVLSHYWGIKKSSDTTAAAANDFLATTVLGLLALLLGFTFSMAISRFDSRSMLVEKEANTIGTAYLRSEVFPAEKAQKYKELLKEYTKYRLVYFEKIRTTNLSYIEKVAELHNQIWKEAVNLIKTDRSPLGNSFMLVNNELIDIDSERTFATENHVPEIVFYVIIIIAALGLGSLSYSLGLRHQRYLTPIILSILFSMVIVLIQDLDRPGRGLIQVHQGSMMRVYNSLHP